MNKLDLVQLSEFVNESIGDFHQARIERIQKINLHEILKKKNPYLFKAKGIMRASDLIASILDAFLSSSEEKLFGDFLEDLAIYIAHQTTNGHKSAVTGIDLEFDRDGVRYLVSIKSGPNWGNASQYASLRNNFKTAIKVLRQSKRPLQVQPVLGICYGKTRTTDNGQYLKVTGQNFWFFLSGNSQLFTDIIEPIGYKARTHNKAYTQEKEKIYNEFTKEFLLEFCPDGTIDWAKLVQFNSGNLREEHWL